MATLENKIHKSGSQQINKLECGPRPNLMAALRLEVAPSAECHNVWLMPTARVSRSNDANTRNARL